MRDVAAAQLAGRRGHVAHDRGQIERRADGADEAREGLALEPPLLRVGVQPRVLERHRRLIGQGPGQLHVFHAEDPARRVDQAERAHHLLLHGQRHRHHRAERALLDVGAHVRGEREARVEEHVVGHDRAALRGGEPDRPGAAGMPQRPLALGRAAGARGLLERPRDRVEVIEGRDQHPEQVARRVHHSLGHPDRMEGLGEGLAHRAQGEALPPPSLGLLEEPGVLERHRGLVREGLGQAQVVVRVGPAERVPDREAAHHLSLHHQRQGQHGRTDRVVDLHVRGALHPAVRPDVGGEHRLPAVHGQAHHAVTGRDHEARIEEPLGLAGAPDHLQVAGGRQQAVEGGGADLEGAQHHVGDALPESGHVEGLGQEAPDLGQGLGGAPPRLALRKEARVADRDRGVARQQVDDLALLRGRLIAVGEGHAQHAHQFAPRGDRDPVVGLEPEVLAPHRRHEARVADRVGQEHRPAALGHRVGDAVAERDDRGHRVRIGPAHRGEPVAAALHVHEADHAEGAAGAGCAPPPRPRGAPRPRRGCRRRSGRGSPPGADGRAKHPARPRPPSSSLPSDQLLPSDSLLPRRYLTGPGGRRWPEP